jgi:hypothetical protein
MRRTLQILLLGVLLVGCSSDPTAPSLGRVNVYLTDAPIDLSTVTAVNVTLEQMILFEYGDDDEGMAMARTAVSGGQGLVVNLLDYQNGESLLIATLDVPTGDYQKVRMVISEAHLVTDEAGVEVVEPIFVPSGKVDVPVPFTVSGGETAEVTLDFDAALSVQVNETGNHRFILRPVITPVGMRMR